MRLLKLAARVDRRQPQGPSDVGHLERPLHLKYAVLLGDVADRFSGLEKPQDFLAIHRKPFEAAMHALEACGDDFLGKQFGSPAFL